MTMQNCRFRPSGLTAIFAAAIIVGGGVANAGALDMTPRLVVAQAAEKPAGEGVIKSVDAGERKLVIKHGPIRALQMPGMTMPFGVAPDVDLSGLAPGAKVKFTLGRDATGIYVIDQISRAK
jgi:Cu(I)/Ag(I) efflux system periplasmic protein CusF